MPIVIPTGVFNVYNEAVTLFERVATLVYPEKKEQCPNCYLDTLGTRTRSVSVYKAGGPYPFGRGMPCPYCDGRGYKAIEVEEDVAKAFLFGQGVSLNDLVDSINAVGASSSDLVAILEALREAGALNAELIVI